MRGIAIIAVAWVIVGFTINALMVVAIQTWGSALNSERRISSSPEVYSVMYARGFGRRAASRNAPEPGLTILAPSWVNLDNQQPGNIQVVTQFAVGWPLPSFTGWWRVNTTPMLAQIRGMQDMIAPHRMWRFELTASLPGGRAADFPLVPIWPGLIVNTLVLGAPALLLLFVTPVRRRRRRQKGKCPRCAYDLKHEFATGCSECGWGKETKTFP